MATNYKVLGQVAPLATTATTLYTVPAATEAVVSTITICNRGTTAATYRIAVRPNGDALANTHYIAYDTAVSANDSIGLTLGITLDAADVVTVYASNADLTFALFGSEIS
jgi:hypothetical protein